MIGEDRREEIEAHLDILKELRKAYLSHYRFMERNASDEYLSSILEDVHQLEEEIMEVRKQLPPPMSQRQLRALEEIPEVWAEVTGKTLQECTDIAAVRDLESTAKRFKEAREEHGTPLWKVDKDSPVGGIFIDGDNVAHVHGTVVAPKMVIEEAPRKTGRTFRSWLCNYFK